METENPIRILFVEDVPADAESKKFSKPVPAEKIEKLFNTLTPDK